jgi:uncharacterized protein YbaP (TraB family)
MLRLGFDPQYGIDLYFLSKAAGNKEVLELESMEQQINLLAGFTPEQQTAFLEQTVNEAEQLPEATRKIKDLWKNGEGEKIYEFTEQSFDESGEWASFLYRKLIIDRNLTMAGRIKEYLAAPKTYFVIVGAGHLLGRQGIVELLKDHGFTAIAPIRTDAGGK